MKAYCVLCRSGAELAVQEKIERYMPQIRALVPQRVLEEKKNSQWQEVTRPLLPGYVFLYSEEELPHDLLRQVRHIYRVLRYERNWRDLQGEDLDYALWLYRHDGLIRPSRVLQAGDEIKVVDGPLLDASGKIIRLDKRHRRVWVSFHFDGEERTVSLSASCIEAQNG